MVSSNTDLSNTLDSELENRVDLPYWSWRGTSILLLHNYELRLPDLNFCRQLAEPCLNGIPSYAYDEDDSNRREDIPD